MNIRVDEDFSITLWKKEENKFNEGLAFVMMYCYGEAFRLNIPIVVKLRDVLTKIIKAEKEKE